MAPLGAGSLLTNNPLNKTIDSYTDIMYNDNESPPIIFKNDFRNSSNTGTRKSLFYVQE